MGLIKRKIKTEALVATEALREDTTPTGPIADLCADIVAHPGSYTFDDHNSIVSRADRKLWIRSVSDQLGYSCFSVRHSTDWGPG